MATDRIVILVMLMMTMTTTSRRCNCTDVDEMTHKGEDLKKERKKGRKTVKSQENVEAEAVRMSTKIRGRMMTRRRQEEQTEMIINLNMTDGHRVDSRVNGKRQRETDRDRNRNREKDRQIDRGQIVETFIKKSQRHAFGFKAA